MKRFPALLFRLLLPLCCALVMLTDGALAQQKAQAAPQAATGGSAAAQQPGTSVTTIRNRAKLVVVDVVVTGKDRAAYQGLKASDFKVLEGGVPQTIKSFEEHTALSEGEALKFPPVPPLPPGIFSNFTSAPTNSAVNILLLDALNTPLKDQAYVRSQLLDYVKKAKPGTSVAIFSLTTQLHMLQGFTTDPERLRQVVKGDKIKTSPLLDNPVSGAAQDNLIDTAGVSGPQAASAGGFASVVSMQESLQLQIRAKYTLDAMSVLARYLANIPGRKNLIWFSGSFPIDILPDPDAADPFIAMADAEEEYRETINQLAISQVAVYPIDARGLMTQPMFDAENSGHKYSTPGSFTKDAAAFVNKTADEQGTMRRMADDTGGEAFVNTNGLSQAVSKAIGEGSNYYTLAYTPTNSKWNGSYREIKVMLDKEGYRLAYRHGYYAEDPDGTKGALAAGAPAEPATPAAPSPGDAGMLHAMVHGLPGPTQIIYKIRVLPASTSTEDKLAPGNRLPSPDPTPKSLQPAPAPPPYRRYVVDYAVDPHDVTFTASADGVYHCLVEFVALVYQQDGRLAVEVTDMIHGDLTRDQFTRLVHGGIPFHQEVSVPVKGDFTIRTGVHDLKADKIGAVEVPLSAVSRLPPAPAAAAAPPTPVPPSK